MSGLVIIPSLSGLAFRASSPLYYHKALSPKGARDHGGRFNRQGTSALYIGLNYETAALEYFAGADPTPVALIPVRYDVKRIIDLTGDLTGCSADWQDWACDWRAALSQPTPDCASWRCGDEAIGMGASGILYPSMYNSSGKALALFTEDAVAGTCKIEVQDPFDSIGRAHPLRP